MVRHSRVHTRKNHHFRRLDQRRGSFSGFRRISLAASAVMIAVMCCSPIASVTCASNPLYLMDSTRPIN